MGRNRKGLRLVTVCLIAALAATLGACGGGGGGGDGDNPSAPNAPANLAAVTASTTQIDLAWTDQATGENGFEVVRGTDQLFTNPVSTIVSANTTSFRDSGLAPSSTYYYRVRSYGSGGSSAYSNTAAATTFTVSTVAGGDGNSTDGTSGTGDSTDGTGATARFNYPYGVTTDGTSLYVADTLNHTIRKVDMTTGTVTTLAGSPTVTGSSDSTDGTGATARFNYPYGIVTNGTVNYVYVADTLNHSIRRVDKWTGAVDTLVGKSGVRGNADGNTLTATFNEPEGIALVGASTLYVADTLNHTIRQINISARSAYTFAGSALVTGSTDSIGTAARFNQPAGIAYDGAGALYVADSRNHTIRKIDIATGSVTTVAGTAGVPGSLNGNGTAALFNQPSGVTVSGSNLYVTDTMNHTIRSIEVSTATSTVTLLSGQTGTAGYVVGAAADSQYNRPFGIVSSGSTLYVADTFNHEIRSVDPADGSSDTLAGSGPASTSASVFNLAHGITIDVNGGNLYVANNSNNNILAVNIATGQTTTIAGSGAQALTDGTGTAAAFNSPVGITTDGPNLYVADTSNNAIRQIEVSTQTVTTIAGWYDQNTNCSDSQTTNRTPSPVCYTNATGTAARFYRPSYLVSDPTVSALYISDTYNHVIRKMDLQSGAVTLLAGYPGHLGSTDGTGTGALFNQPVGLAIDDSGTYLYVADLQNSTIRRVEIATGMVTTIAGKAGYNHSADGVGTAASFNRPWAITLRGTSLYIADTMSHIIRKLDLATNEVTTVAGTVGVPGYDNGTGTGSKFNWPRGIAADSTSIYVSDTYNKAIRVIQ